MGDQLFFDAVLADHFKCTHLLVSLVVLLAEVSLLPSTTEFYETIDYSLDDHDKF